MKSITLTREEKMEDEEYARLYQEFRDIQAKQNQYHPSDQEFISMELEVRQAHRNMLRRGKELEKFKKRQYCRNNTVSTVLNNDEADLLDEYCYDHKICRSEFIRNIILETIGGKNGSST